jgi:hypothetical protein
MKTAFLRPDEAEGTLTLRTVIDVGHDGLTLFPCDSTSLEAAVRGNLLLGVASTVLESCLVREQRPTAPVTGAYATFTAAAAAGAAPRFGRGPDYPGVDLLPLARWALSKEPAGNLAAFPGGGEVSTWFSLDPATGQVIGRGGGGEGQSLAEYKAAIKTAMKNLKCMVGAGYGMAGGKSSGANSYDWFKCMTGFDPGKASSYAKAVGDYQKATMGLKAFSTMASALGGIEKVMKFTSR